MQDNNIVGIAKAAELTNRSPKTLYGDISKGKVSAFTDPVTNKKQIDIAELIRVYGPIKIKTDVSPEMSENKDASQAQTWLETLEREKKIVLLETENSGLRERLRETAHHAESNEEKMQAHINDLKEQITSMKLLVDLTKKRPWWQFWK